MVVMEDGIARSKLNTQMLKLDWVCNLDVWLIVGRAKPYNEREKYEFPFMSRTT
jgi:hypothetical protein